MELYYRPCYPEMTPLPLFGNLPVHDVNVRTLSAMILKSKYGGDSVGTFICLCKWVIWKYIKHFVVMDGKLSEKTLAIPTLQSITY